jgi:hypothetical protein
MPVRFHHLQVRIRVRLDFEGSEGLFLLITCFPDVTTIFDVAATDDADVSARAAAEEDDP